MSQQPASLPCHFSARSEHGMALVISLILLLIMTMMGVTAMRGTTLQERMAGSLQDQNRAFQAAETALRRAEQALSQPQLPAFGGDGWYSEANKDQIPDWMLYDASPDATGAVQLPAETVPVVARQPQFFVQRIEGVAPAGSSLDASADQTDLDLYRLTARGFGANETTVVLLETMFRR